MMRRALAIAAVLVVSGLLPLAAASGLCASKPCCRAHDHAHASSVAASRECCTEINCNIATRDTDATSAKNISVPPQVAMVAVAPYVIATTMPASESASGRCDTGPPPTRQRLATLSTLLI